MHVPEGLIVPTQGLQSVSMTVGTVSLAVARAGRGPPLLLLHDGGSSAARDFTALVPPLSERFGVIAPDMRGHGASERVERIFWPGLTRDLAGLLERLDVGRAHVLGVGDGATLALHLAREEPDRVASLVLAGARAHVPDEDVQRMDALRPDNLMQGAPELAEDLHRVHGPTWRHLMDRWVTSFRLDRAYLDVRSRLREIPQPALVLHGSRDPLTPTRHAELIADGLPNASLVVLECGRRVQDAPEFPRVVAGFWAGPGKAFTDARAG